MTDESRQVRRARERAEAKGEAQQVIDSIDTITQDRTDWNAINKDTKAIRLDQFLIETLDDRPEDCNSLVGSMLMGWIDQMDFIYESAAKNVNTHILGVDMHLGAGGKTIPMSDMFVEVRDATRSQTEHCIDSFIKEWESGTKKLLMPGIYYGIANKSIGLETVITYSVEWGVEAVQMVIKGMKQPSGVIKTLIEFKSVPKAVHIQWDTMRKGQTEHMGAVSW